MERSRRLTRSTDPITSHEAAVEHVRSGTNESQRVMVLAALLRGPNAAPETVAKRACAVAESFDPPHS